MHFQVSLHQPEMSSYLGTHGLLQNEFSDKIDTDRNYEIFDDALEMVVGEISLINLH